MKRDQLVIPAAAIGAALAAYVLIAMLTGWFNASTLSWACGEEPVTEKRGNEIVSGTKETGKVWQADVLTLGMTGKCVEPER